MKAGFALQWVFMWCWIDMYKWDWIYCIFFPWAYCDVLSGCRWLAGLWEFCMDFRLCVPWMWQPWRSSSGFNQLLPTPHCSSSMLSTWRIASLCTTRRLPSKCVKRSASFYSNLTSLLFRPRQSAGLCALELCRQTKKSWHPLMRQNVHCVSLSHCLSVDWPFSNLHHINVYITWAY